MLRSFICICVFLATKKKEKEKRRVDDSSNEGNFQNLTPIKAALFNNETALINAVTQDDNTRFLLHSRQLIHDSDDDPSNRRSVALKLLFLCCYFDAVECATSLLNGDVETDFLPVVNEVDTATKMTALHSAAEAQAARCVELLLNKRARTELRSEGGRGLLALETALSSNRMDVIWNPDDYSVEELVVLLSEKDLTAVKLLSEKTKAIGEVAYSIAMGGKIVALAALLIVAAEKVNESIIVLRDAESGSKEKDTVYQCVIREALLLGRPDTSPLRAAKRHCTLSKVESDKKRKLLLCEIELLQLFGAIAENVCGDKKMASPLILAIKVARDEAVVERLLKTNMDVNDADAEGNTALHWSLRMSWSSSSQQIKIIWLLLKHGARVNQRNKLELTAFHTAAANGNTQALQVLLLEDPDGINYKTIMKETPLFFAVKNDHIDCAELLQRWGANSEVLNLRRERPIDLAKSQDMRFMLNPTNITLMNRNPPVQQIYTPCFQGDEIIFDTCESLLTTADEGSCTERIGTSVKTEICKYFESSGGCARGSSCFYAHGEEKLRQVKQGMHLIHSSAVQKLKRKIFVGGLNPLLDSDSLGKFFEDQFGSVEDAHVARIRTGDEVHSRGFGFVTFKHEKSVSKAVQAHYITIMGKQVEIKSAVGRWDESLKPSLQQHYQEQNDQYQPQLERSSEKTAQEMPRRKTLEEAKADQISCVNKLLHDQPKTSSESQVPVGPISTNHNTPVWLRTFKKWLPSFLEEVSKKAKEGDYPLSSLKADFRAAFGLELDHASLGYHKLSDFMRSFPDLCRMKVTPVGGCGSPNHMVLMPHLPRPGWKLLQPLTMFGPPCCAAQPDENADIDSKYVQDLVSDSCENVSISSGEVKPYQNIPQENSAVKDSSPVVHSKFLQFLKSDFRLTQPKLYKERKSQTGNANDERGTHGFSDTKFSEVGRHLVLEALQRKRNNTSMFFLREFDFYHNYKASIKQGKCLWCNKPNLLWANFPCQHLLWCGDCRIEAARAGGDFDHRCVVCDVKVQKFILPTLDRYSHSLLHGKILKHEEFPPFDPSHIRNASKKNYL
ncbi:RNA recognition motif domain - like 10 [Theobroma cacao]|nr:RNA recognition motif domain - like 10 [Theobroma cacao]